MPPGRPGKVDRERLCLAIEAEAGNITRAAALAGVSRVHAMRLATRYGLRAYACELRLSAGGKATGRPRYGATSARCAV